MLSSSTICSTGTSRRDRAVIDRIRSLACRFALHAGQDGCHDENVGSRTSSTAGSPVPGCVRGGYGDRRLGQEQVLARVPKADLDQRDTDYIRDQLPGTWLLALLYFRADVRGLNRENGGPSLNRHPTNLNAIPFMIRLIQIQTEPAEENTMPQPLSLARPPDWT